MNEEVVCGLLLPVYNMTTTGLLIVHGFVQARNKSWSMG